MVLYLGIDRRKARSVPLSLSATTAICALACCRMSRILVEKPVQRLRHRLGLGRQLRRGLWVGSGLADSPCKAPCSPRKAGLKRTGAFSAKQRLQAIEEMHLRTGARRLGNLARMIGSAGWR